MTVIDDFVDSVLSMKVNFHILAFLQLKEANLARSNLFLLCEDKTFSRKHRPDFLHRVFGL